MGMFDYLRVDGAVIPPWTSSVSRSSYNAEVAELTSESGGQVKDLFLTLDNYEITANGYLIRTTESWREQVHRLSSDGIQQLESALPVEGRPGCWHVVYSGLLIPGAFIEFAVESGRLVKATIPEHRSTPPVSKWQRKKSRAESLARRFGDTTRTGKKWNRVYRRLVKRGRAKYFVIDEAHLLFGSETSSVVKSMRHAGVTQDLVSQTAYGNA